jgi:photosystem II stability/assembly factor-like uncharacterized protein
MASLSWSVWIVGILVAAEPAVGPMDMFKELKFRSVGPAAGGRVCRVAGVPGNPLIYYAATAGSGVWKSTDGGINWKPIFDEQPCASAGSIAVAPSDPNVIYVGAGEANIRGNVASGNGIYKSTDAGKTWKHVWKATAQIGTMVVHPKNADIAYAAVLGRAFGPSEERGIYRTTDGGTTWKRVHFVNRDTGASDIGMDSSNPRILFAGFWEARRRPWSLTSGGPGSGLFVSRDGGDTWKELADKGLPKKPWGKVGVAVAPSDGRRVYALIEAEKGGLFVSYDGGEKWSLATDDRALRQRAWYYSTLTVDPTNADVLWAPQVPLLKSIDGGKSFRRVSGTHHGDHHDVWIDPANPKRIIDANDGGVDLSTDGGETWYAPPLPIAQFYRVTVDRQNPYQIYGTMQDLGSAAGPSNSLTTGGIDVGEWKDVGGGEAGYVAVDPTDPNIVFAGEYDGIFTRIDRRIGTARHVGAYPFNSSGHGAEDKKYRFRWPAPAMFSHHNPKALYHAANVLFRSLDGGQSWTALGGDLTRNDKSRQQWSGGPITGDNTGAEHYCTLSAIAESRAKAGILWTGSDDGLVHVSQDDGRTWTNVTAAIPGFPEWGTVQHIETSRTSPGTAYVVVDAHLMDDYRPYLWKTTDFGKNWSSLTHGLPGDVPLHVVREDSVHAHVLFLGTERGVMMSTDGGTSWHALKAGLPTVAVHDLQVTESDLVVSTMGRSIWILDDITPLRSSTQAVRDSQLHLYPPSPATLWGLRSGSRRPGRGSNPPYGALIQYYLKSESKDIKLEILDGNQTVVAELEGEKKEDDEDSDQDSDGEKKIPVPGSPGVHRIVWNLRGKAPKRIAKAKIDAGNLNVGPVVVPGKYSVRLTVSGQTKMVPLEVRPDPRSTVLAEVRTQQRDFVQTIRDDITRLTKAVEKLRLVRRQLAERNAVLKHVKDAASLVEKSKDAIKKLDDFEARLHNPKAKVTYDILSFKGGAKLYSQLSSLYSFASDGEGPPTQGMKDVYADYSKELQAVLSDLDRFYSGTLVELNAAAKAKDWPTVLPIDIP